MNFRRKSKVTLGLKACLVAVVWGCLVLSVAGCVNRSVYAINEARTALEHRDYHAAMAVILRLDDAEIASSDVLMLMLSTAYYGLELTPVQDIAADCYDMDFIDGGNTVVFTDFENGALNYYSYPGMQSLRTVKLPFCAYNTAVSTSGNMIAIAMGDNTIRICDPHTGDCLNLLYGHGGRVRDVVFGSDDLLFSTGNDRTVAAWDTHTGESLWVKKIHSKNIKRLSLSKDRSRLVTSSNDGASCIVSATGYNAGTVLLRVVHGSNYVNGAVISPDNKKLITVSGDGSAKVWDTNGGHLMHIFDFNDELCSVDITDNGRYAIIGGRENAYIIDVKNLKTISVINGMNMPMWNVMIDGDSFHITDNTRLWAGSLLTGHRLISAARALQ